MVQEEVYTLCNGNFKKLIIRTGYRNNPKASAIGDTTSLREQLKNVNVQECRLFFIDPKTRNV